MPSRYCTRRRVLATTALALAGCVSTPDETDGDDPGGTGRPTTTSTPTDDSGYDLAVEHDLESWSGYDPDWSAPTDSPLTGSVDTTVLVENLEIPWDLAFAPTGELFLTERTGRILRFESGDVTPVASPDPVIDAGSVGTDVEEVPWWVEGGEGGLLGVAVHPSYPDPPLVYAYYTYQDGEQRYNRVSYFDATADDPAETETVVVDGIPGENIHNGGRITFGPANYLWITTGDAGDGEVPQDLSSLGGKILRVTPDGSPAPDNPDLGDGADDRIFTYGHRNPQGIVWLPDGTPVASEHGPNGRDEINHLVAGDDYGWSNVREREDYPGSGVHRPLANSGPPSWAPTGSVFYTGDAIPAWRNRMVTGALVSQQLLVTTLTPAGADLPPAEDALERFDQDWTDPHYTATMHTTFENRLGRIRHVEQGPDGGLYAITSNRDGRADEGFPAEGDDVLVRIGPA